MAERYSAHLKVHRTTTPEQAPDGSRRIHSSSPQLKKQTESVDITVRAATLEKLSEKVAAHLALLDSDDFISEPITETTCR